MSNAAWWNERLAWLTKEAGTSVTVMWEVFFGLRSFVTSLGNVLMACDVLVSSMRYTVPALAFVGLNALGLWLLAQPLAWLGLFQYHWRDAVKASSLFALVGLRAVLPEFSGSIFFAVLRMRDEKLAASIKGTPSVHSKRSRLRSLLLFVGTASSAVAVLGPLVLPVLVHLLAIAATAVGGFLAVWWLVLLVVLPVVGVTLACGFQAYLLIQPFLRAWHFDPVLVLLLSICVALGVIELATPGDIVRSALVFYCSCSVLTHEFLVHYTKRLQKEKREKFFRRHCWRLLGFGVPVWLLINSFPLAAVALLEVLHGAAASLLVDLLELDGGPTMAE